MAAIAFPPLLNANPRRRRRLFRERRGLDGLPEDCSDYRLSREQIRRLVEGYALSRFANGSRKAERSCSDPRHRGKNKSWQMSRKDRGLNIVTPSSQLPGRGVY